MIEIVLGSQEAILLAIENFIEHAKYAAERNKEKGKVSFDSQSLIFNIESIFRDTEKQRFWIEKGLEEYFITKK